MKRFSSFCSLFLITIVQAWAWGANGHRTVGLIAQQHLTPKARWQIMHVLECNSLAEVSTWMDDIKSDTAYNHTHDWHFVTIPDGQTYEQAEKSAKGDVIAKIEELRQALKQKDLPKEKQQEYLKFLVHLVGDLHQPLHVGRGDDRGGNDIKVTWFGTPSNLHRVWDSDMIESKELSFTELAGFAGSPSKQQIKAWQSGSVREWAYESMKYRPMVYKLPEDKKLGYRYSYENFDLVQLRLLQAGIRLAGLLNEIYG